MNNIEELQEIINNEEIDYYYHITSSNGNDILSDGLILANPDWYQSFLKFTDEELNNIDMIIKENISNLKNNNTILIVAVYKDIGVNFIRKLREDEKYSVIFEGVDTPEYIVDPRYILGYIDIDTEMFHLNPEAEVCDSLYL